MRVRNNQSEQVWQVAYNKNGFEYYLYIRGTADEVYDYLDSEMGFVGRHHALNEAEIEMVRKLKTKIYIAPEL